PGCGLRGAVGGRVGACCGVERRGCPGLATATCAGPTTPSMNVAARPWHDGVRHPWRTILLVQAMCAGCLTPAARTARERGGATVARRCQTPLAHHPA